MFGLRNCDSSFPSPFQVVPSISQEQRKFFSPRSTPCLYAEGTHTQGSFGSINILEVQAGFEILENSANTIHDRDSLTPLQISQLYDHQDNSPSSPEETDTQSSGNSPLPWYLEDPLVDLNVDSQLAQASLSSRNSALSNLQNDKTEETILDILCSCEDNEDNTIGNKITHNESSKGTERSHCGVLKSQDSISAYGKDVDDSFSDDDIFVSKDDDGDKKENTSCGNSSDDWFNSL